MTGRGRGTDQVEQRFGSGPPFALGVEEELLLVDPVTRRLAHVFSAVHERVAVERGDVKADAYEALVELATPVVGDAGAAAADLRRLRAAVSAAGPALIGAGIHPDGAFGDVVHVPEPRYDELAASMRGLLRRTPTAAIHVHVGMPDAETAIRVANRLREWLPLLQGLAANSPFWHGVDSGLASARAVLFRGFPRSMVPRAFAGYEDWVETVTAVEAAGELDDYTWMWWDVRPHPMLGTVEVRAMDAQARLASAAGLAALVHGLARAAAERPPPARWPAAEAIDESSFRAARDGLAATIWHAGTRRPLPEVARAALAEARAAGGDSTPVLEEVERILAEGGGADRQRAAHARGGMEAILRLLAEETAGGAPQG